MNINRTFSIPVATAMKLKAERNQSRTVAKAVNKFLNEKEGFSVGDVETRAILSLLTSRSDLPEHIRVIIQQYLRDN